MLKDMAMEMRLCSKTMALTSVLPTKMHHFKVENMKMPRQRERGKGKTIHKPLIKRRLVLMSSMSNSDMGSNLFSVSRTIKQFYECINSKNVDQLGEFISDNCLIEDCSFPNTFGGKQEVKFFFSRLVASMGENVEFKIGNICTGDDFDGAVNWHLGNHAEWNKKKIPFTRGCCFYKFSVERATLVIKKCFIVTESPIKPGGSALNLLRTVSTLFDKFPKAAEWFLRSPQELLQMIIKIYSIFFRPFLIPVLAWYTNLWKLTGRLLSYVLAVYITISKFFYKE